MTENVNRTAFDVCQIDYVLHEVVALERASERRRISVVGNIQMDNDITENNNRWGEDGGAFEAVIRFVKQNELLMDDEPAR